jgi:hypothetical protein
MQESPGTRIERLRRRATNCLYCPAPANSEEHILSEGVGGRLIGRILCGSHNCMINKVADEPFCARFAQLTFAAEVRRQRGNAHGKIGTSVKGIDDSGRPVTVRPDGSSEWATTIDDRDADGLPLRFGGPLSALRKLAKEHPQREHLHLFEVVHRGVTIPVKVGIDNDSYPALIKTALHFAATFFDVPALSVETLEQEIFGKAPIKHVFQPPFATPLFDPSGPIRHEVTVYPHGDSAIVTVMLFAAFGIGVTIPGLHISTPLRYQQLIDGTGPQVYNVSPIAIEIRRPTEEELREYFRTSGDRLHQIFNDKGNREINEIAMNAAAVAFSHSLRGPEFETFFVYFRAELDRSALDTEVKDDLMRLARFRAAKGLPLCDISRYPIVGA